MQRTTARDGEVARRQLRATASTFTCEKWKAAAVLPRGYPQYADGETLPQVLAALKEHYQVKEPAIADALGVHVSTVNTWVHGKATPRPAALRKLAEAYPAFPEARLFAAIGKRAPAPMPPDRRDAVLAVMDRLTEEQQELILVQARAVADSNDQK